MFWLCAKNSYFNPQTEKIMNFHKFWQVIACFKQFMPTLGFSFRNLLHNIFISEILSTQENLDLDLPWKGDIGVL